MTAALGSMTIPAMTGLVSQAIGLERGMRSLVIWGIALFAVGVYIYRHKQKQKRYAQSVQSVDSD
jgi:predicted membrane channel-forming protein YqfA (hemolysin III family)